MYIYIDRYRYRYISADGRFWARNWVVFQTCVLPLGWLQGDVRSASWLAARWADGIETSQKAGGRLAGCKAG